MEKTEFTLYGYDKDGDVYAPLCASPSEKYITMVATAVTHYNSEVYELRREDTGEPFDWFLVMESDRIRKVFTAEHPEGFEP